MVGEVCKGGGQLRDKQAPLLVCLRCLQPSISLPPPPLCNRCEQMWTGVNNSSKAPSLHLELCRLLLFKPVQSSSE